MADQDMERLNRKDQPTDLALYALRKEMREGFAEMRVGFEQINRRLTTLIEIQGSINQHVDRQIGALEYARRRQVMRVIGSRSSKRSGRTLAR